MPAAFPHLAKAGSAATCPGDLSECGTAQGLLASRPVPTDGPTGLGRGIQVVGRQSVWGRTPLGTHSGVQNTQPGPQLTLECIQKVPVKASRTHHPQICHFGLRIILS